MKILVAVCMLSGGVAWADKPTDWRGDHPGGGNDRKDNGKHTGFGAPEPITMIGLAAGAGVVGLGAWRKRRQR